MRHPAFGLVRVTHPSGSTTLFQSDATHPECVRISIYRAHVDRSLGRDWIHDDECLVEFELSPSQFVNMVSSHSGRMTPITLRREMGQSIPGIVPPESKVETHRREVEQSVREISQELKACVQELQQMVEDGRLSKKELRAKLHNLSCAVSNLAPNMGHSVTQAQEAIEVMANHAKVEIESYFDSMVRRIGHQTINKLRQQLGESQPQTLIEGDQQ
jgi:hypothetical protein